MSMLILIFYSGGGNHHREINCWPLRCMRTFVGHAQPRSGSFQISDLQEIQQEKLRAVVFVTQVKIAVRSANHEVKRGLVLGLGVFSFLFNFDQCSTFTVKCLTLCDEIVMAMEE